MTSFYGFDGLRAIISDRKQRLLAEAQRERVARQAQRRVAEDRPLPAASQGDAPGQPEVEWGPWLQGGEPVHLSHAGAGLS